MKTSIPKNLFIAIVLIGLLFSAGQVVAQEKVGTFQAGGNVAPLQAGGNVSGDTFTLKNPLKVDSIGGLVKNFVEIFSYIAILFAVVVLIYIGFKYVLYSAQGNSKGIGDLHSWLLWTVVGVAVVIGARVIVEIVINTLGLTGTISPGVINSASNALKP
ncbi:MAG: hypothetical protein WC666_02865 [Candidatus Paceibacterota bacterium]|jgi:hypothetical protein